MNRRTFILLLSCLFVLGMIALGSSSTAEATHQGVDIGWTWNQCRAVTTRKCCSFLPFLISATAGLPLTMAIPSSLPYGSGTGLNLTVVRGEWLIYSTPLITGRVADLTSPSWFNGMTPANNG
jgi:hypothetical protein